MVRTVPQRVKVSRHLRRRRESAVWRGEIERITKVGKSTLGGIQQKRIVYLSSPQGRRKKAMVKVTGSLTEAVADTIDELLGWDLVPPVSGREMSPELQEEFGESEIVTIHEWMEGSGRVLWGTLERKPEEFVEKNDDRLLKMAALDFIIANLDRHEGNMLVSRSGRVYAIDHAFSFEYGAGEIFHPTWTTFNYAAGRPIPKNIMRDLRNLEEGDLRAAVSPLGEKAVEGTVFRWKVLLKKGRFPEKSANDWGSFFTETV